MPQNTHLESLASSPQAAAAQSAGTPVHDLEALSGAGRRSARELVWLHSRKSGSLADRVKGLQRELGGALVLQSEHPAEEQLSDDQRWFYEHLNLLRSTLTKVREAASAASLGRLPHARREQAEGAAAAASLPRIVFVAEDLLAALEFRFADAEFAAFVKGFQSVNVLSVAELRSLPLAMKLVLLERVAAVALRESCAGAGAAIRSLQALEETPWQDLLEPLVAFEHLLRQDPAGAYAIMDFESREMYRFQVVHLAEHSDCSEVEIARLALKLAQEAAREPEGDPRLMERHSHIGYYLIDAGQDELRRRAKVRLPLEERLQNALRRTPDEFYLVGIEVLTLLTALAILWRAIDVYPLASIFFAAVVLLLPSSQSAVEIMNYLTTSLLHPRRLPKLDFEDGIPPECATMVVVPTLLLSEKQVRQLVHDLEVRYVGNLSPNLHFALLTDLPDTADQASEDDPRVELCGQLIRELNKKYAGNGNGSFAMFHRHRVYNPREGVWMGWERKRGKLLDFNRLVLGDYDSFPYKTGNLSVLRQIRYVLTLDVDTVLPRGAASKLVGTLAHPLCQAIIDPKRNVVTAGFGILQPRVGVSVESARQSRMAAIFSGQTGFDIYTRAVSDVYQDLYGEGSFTGKGLYEVRTLHRVLEHRFPRNSLLSHDLIEGAYTRAGLVSDVEVIDNYPSHYSAFTRRKHRWLRGDWQIVEWLFPRVPDESGRRVLNPISIVSRWKIFDNLRRSMVEPATFALLLLGWTVLPGSPLYWTLAALAIYFLPPWVQFAFNVLRGLRARQLSSLADAVRSIGGALLNLLMTLTFLVHNTLVATDAIWRALYRRMVSRERLLEWETAAEAEAGSKRTIMDLYLDITPVIAIAIAVLLAFTHRAALAPAAPVLFLWALGKPISLWLDRPPNRSRKPLSIKNRRFLRRTALRTWRYYAEHSNREHNWLIPDNVVAEPARVVARISPTNLGFLLNARQVACEFGYLTVPEFTEQTRQTLATMNRMFTYRGHLANWYNTRTLEAELPRFVSSVDSGNLAASLIALAGGCEALLSRPLLSSALVEGCDDYLRELIELKALTRRQRRELRNAVRTPWLERLRHPEPEPAIPETNDADARWAAAQWQERRRLSRQTLADYQPWLLPEFDGLRESLAAGAPSAQSRADQPLLPEQVPLARLPETIRHQRARVEAALAQHRRQLVENGDTAAAAEADRCEQLLSLLAGAHARATWLVHELELIADEAASWVARMDFGFLLDHRRKLLSIGYHLEEEKLQTACYDLLASEARIASFIAIAKGDVPQELWLRLGRPYAAVDDPPTLLSWTGTMFEYLMPALWMRAYPGTLLERSMEGAVRAQQAYAAELGIPWGISESGYAELDDAGNYMYRAFTVPLLAVNDEPTHLRVVAPYAAALAVGVDPVASLRNLRRMADMGWFGSYGFYEAADFTADRRRARLVKSWMAHHQGMSLLAIANFLREGMVQEWFHRDVRVQATELLLEEWPSPSQIPARRPRQPQRARKVEKAALAS